MVEFTKVSKFNLKNINLKVEKGEFIVLSGNGGSGKTTLIRLVSGDLLPDEGTVKLTISDASSLTTQRRKIGFIPQQGNILEEKSVFANLEIPLKLLGEYNKSTIISTLEKLGLYEYCDTKALRLSSSYQQLLKIALSVAKNPLLLLADEPFQNLAPEQETQVISLLKNLNTLGTTILFATSRTLPQNSVATGFCLRSCLTRELRLTDGEIIHNP